MLFREDQVARADAEAIRKGVGFYRWTHDLVEITGKDALEVLQKIYISDISKVAVGRSKYTASLDEAGEIIDDVIVMHMADGLYWVSDLYGPRLLPWIEQHKGEADIHAKIITYDWDMYAVQGPDSLKAMNAMLDAPVDDLKRFGICERKLGGIPVYIHRSGFTGENGYEIYSAFTLHDVTYCYLLFLTFLLFSCVQKHLLPPHQELERALRYSTGLHFCVLVPLLQHTFYVDLPFPPTPLERCPVHPFPPSPPHQTASKYYRPPCCIPACLPP